MNITQRAEQYIAPMNPRFEQVGIIRELLAENEALREEKDTIRQQTAESIVELIKKHKYDPSMLKYDLIVDIIAAIRAKFVN
jgi:hypothetical protein